MLNRRIGASVAILTALATTPALAQSIDAGRGPVPLAVPARYDADVPTPLIVALHGYTSSGERHVRSWNLDAAADEYNVLLIAPDGPREAQGRQNRFWNASSACCNFESQDTDDSSYILHLIESIEERYNVDDARVYVVGHSNGGFMSHRMAYEHSGVIAAIASLAGATGIEERDPPPYPVHVLEIHGTDDGTIDYRGGEIEENRYPSAMTTVRTWARYNGCDMAPKGRELRDLDASLPGYETGVMKMNTGCKDGGSAELWTIADGAHSPTYSDSFAAQIVEWLLAHPKPGYLIE